MKWWEEEIIKIDKDSVNGATFLTKEAVLVVKKMAISNENLNDIKIALNRLLYTQPMMASIYNFAGFMLKEFNKSISYEKIVNFCERYLSNFNNSNEEIIKKCTKILDDKSTILTHSFSSLVYNSLIEAKRIGKDLEVICSESRPKNEGVTLAQKLCENGIKATLIIDVAAPFFVKDIDLVLLGADGIGQFGLVHKIGTFPIAMAAKKFRKKVISLVPSQKIWPKEFKEPGQSLKEAGEVAKGCFDVKNIYFDITPLEYIDSIITEKDNQFTFV